MLPPTPYYLIDERKLTRNLARIRRVRERAGAKSVLALKCFSTWAVFPLMRQYMEGTTSSSLYEARLGHEQFGGETHAYCVGWSDSDMRDVVKVADKVLFNSVSQLERFGDMVKTLPVGLRVNPGVSYSHFDLADPARAHSRLGVLSVKDVRAVVDRLTGLMFHCNCENDDFGAFSRLLDTIERRYGALLKRMEWVSLGGGIFFTRDGYPLDDFCRRLKQFSEHYGVQVYLEPGEAAVTRSTELVTTVVDVVHNRGDIAIVDASIEGHMLDLLVYREQARMELTGPGAHTYTIAGRSCLAGDIFGTFRFPRRLKVGSTVRIGDAGGYTMVKKNWFNGLQMPSIVVRRLDGSTEVVREFGYRDFKNSLS